MWYKRQLGLVIYHPSVHYNGDADDDGGDDAAAAAADDDGDDEDDDMKGCWVNMVYSYPTLRSDSQWTQTATNLIYIIMIMNIMSLKIYLKNVNIDDDDNGWYQGQSLLLVTPDICHNHHNRWLCKLFQSSVKFSSGYVNETALILRNMCSFTKSV